MSPRILSRPALSFAAAILATGYSFFASPALSASARPASPLGIVGSYPPETVYSLALHMHGSMSEQFGSWEWHAWKASGVGVDVVWWTDHDWRLTNYRHMTNFDFENIVWETLTHSWVEPDDAFPGGVRTWAVLDSTETLLLTSPADTLAYEGNQSLRIEATSAPSNPEFETGYMEQRASQFQQRTSLAKRIRLRFAVFPEQLDANAARFVLETELSDHPEGTHILRYVVGDMEGEGVHSIPLAFTPNTWNAFEVDVTADAIAHFSIGGRDTLRAEDNALASVKIGLETQSGSRAVVFFDDYQIIPDPTLVGDVLLDRARAMGDYYEDLYPTVTNYHGSEISKFKAQPHLNAFAPNHQLVDYTGYQWSDTLHYAIDQIHGQGGAVSLNHIMGTADVERTPQQEAAWLQYSKTILLHNNVLGVDILEVGYRHRGGMDLQQHLDLWDTMLANGRWITGNGVTDSHGRGSFIMEGWGPSEDGWAWRNNFVTWLHTESFDELGFIRAMKSGRAFFGDPYRWDGTLDMQTNDGFRMGQVVVTDRNQHDLAIEVTNVTSGVQVRLRQGEVRENQGTAYLDTNWLRDETLTGAVSDGVYSDTVTVDTSLPCFVRCEVMNDLGEEMIFSNPIHFVPTVPAMGISPQRLAVRTGDVRIFRAESFVLTNVEWEEALLTLRGEETAPGLGEIWLDPGALGAPTSVSGVESWDYIGGTVRLMGFSGVDTRVQISWSATAAADGVGEQSAFALSAGRPNPFGQGTVFDYSIPREAWVRLEVVDTAGRRVRVLAAEFQAAGRHRAEWDGRDGGGRPVASGIYHLRLEHDGEVLLRKVVRLR